MQRGEPRMSCGSAAASGDAVSVARERGVFGLHLCVSLDDDLVCWGVPVQRQHVWDGDESWVVCGWDLVFDGWDRDADGTELVFGDLPAELRLRAARDRVAGHPVERICGGTDEPVLRVVRIERGVRDRWVHVLGVCGQRGRDGDSDLGSVQHTERGVADDGIRGGLRDCRDEHVCELHDHGGTVCGWDDELRWELPGDGRGVFGRVWAVCPDGDGGVQPGWLGDDGVRQWLPACDDTVPHVGRRV